MEEGGELGAAFFILRFPFEKLKQNIELISLVKFRIKFRESTSRQREKWSKLSVLMSDCIRHFRTKMLKEESDPKEGSQVLKLPAEMKL